MGTTNLLTQVQNSAAHGTAGSFIRSLTTIGLDSVNYDTLNKGALFMCGKSEATRG